jgi:hypothetical protein
MVFNRENQASAFRACSGTDPFVPVQACGVSGDRTPPRIVISDARDLRQLIRIADLDYSEKQRHSDCVVPRLV